MRFRTMRVKQEKRRRSEEVNLEADLQWRDQTVYAGKEQKQVEYRRTMQDIEEAKAVS